jgi:hypothetical protein
VAEPPFLYETAPVRILLEKYVRFPRRPITFPCAGGLGINIGDGALSYRPDTEFKLNFSNPMDQSNSSDGD